MKQRLFWLGAVFVLALALWLRLPQLGDRPFHADESVHAEKFRALWQGEGYKYNPDEFHGPTLYYATLPVMAARGVRTFAQTREADYRLVTAIFGAALVLLPLALSDRIGRKAALFAALLAAVSPAHVYYSRHYVQETLLVFFSQAAFVCGVRFFASRRPGWLLGVGVFAGLMLASKETAVVAFGFALLGLWIAGRGAALPQRLWAARTWLAGAALAGIVVASLFLSGFGSNWRAPLDLVRSLAIWSGRGGSTAMHRHPAWYFLEVVFWSRREGGMPYTESLIALLLVVGLIAGRNRPGALRRITVFYSVVGLGLLAFYSALPYKTPWCAVDFLNAMTVPAGVGAAALLDFRRSPIVRVVVAALLCAGFAHLARQAWELSFRYATAGRNPYAYAQTSPDVLNLARRVEELAKADPDGDRMYVQIISDDGYIWPLPWYLRRFKNLWPATDPRSADPRVPVVLAASSLDEAVTRRLDATHLMTGYFGLRPGAIYECFVRMDLWQRYLQTRPKPPEQQIDPKYE